MSSSTLHDYVYMLGLSLRRLQTPSAYAFSVSVTNDKGGGGDEELDWVMVEAPSAPRKASRARERTDETSLRPVRRALKFED